MGNVLSLRRRHVLSWRLRRQHIAALDAGDAVQVSRRLCGIQAQVMSSAVAAVAVRRPTQAPPQPPVTQVEEDLATGRLVRTWAMRGTLHLLPSDEAWAYLSLLGAARTWSRPAWQKRFGTAEQLTALTDAVCDLLADGHCATREDLVEAVLDRTGDVRLGEHLASSWGSALKPLAWQGLIVQGPPRGNRTTFRSPDATVPGWRPQPWDLAAAARHAVTSYLGAHGPATIDAFDAWLLRGVTPRRQLRSWFADPGLEACEVDVEGRRCLARAVDAEAMEREEPDPTLVRLLPGFDQFILGPGTGDPHVVPTAHRAQVSRASGWISPVVVTCDGVVGTWQPGGAGDEVRVSLFPDAPAVDPAALRAETARVETVLRFVPTPEAAG